MPKIQIDCFIDEFSTPNREWNYKKFKNHFISEHKCLNFLLHGEKTKLDEIQEIKHLIEAYSFNLFSKKVRKRVKDFFLSPYLAFCWIQIGSVPLGHPNPTIYIYIYQMKTLI